MSDAPDLRKLDDELADLRSLLGLRDQLLKEMEDAELERNRARTRMREAGGETEQQRLAGSERRLEDANRRLAKLKELQARHDLLVAQKEERLRSSGGEAGRRLIEIPKELEQLNVLERRIIRALEDGRRMIAAIAEMKKEAERSPGGESIDPFENPMGPAIILVRELLDGLAEARISQLAKDLRSFDEAVVDLVGMRVSDALIDDGRSEIIERFGETVGPPVADLVTKLFPQGWHKALSRASVQLQFALGKLNALVGETRARIEKLGAERAALLTNAP